MVSCNPLDFFPSFIFILDRKTNVDIWRKFYRVHVSTSHTLVGTMHLADLGANSGMLSCVDIDFLSVQNHESVYSCLIYSCAVVPANSMFEEIQTAQVHLPMPLVTFVSTGRHQ
jgi:hypothetical protein